ncbi:MAG: metallophosphoesterase family protein [Planctomycetota bacterium]|nr:metallophosphoesterase family protein [Planctomycetota bacterium]
MSRRAIISDIHSNVVALDAVLTDIHAQQVDSTISLGDICGYGPDPLVCIERIRQYTAWTLQGNHDEALFVEPHDFGKNARLAIEWQRTVLEPQIESSQEDEERWYWLQNLPPSRAEKDVLFVHASPREPLYEYVLREDFEDSGFGLSEKARGIFAAVPWLCFCGHSHRPGVVTEDYRWWRPEELDDYTFIIKRGRRTLVNVGSVGQPRDAIPLACYCIFDYPDSADLEKTAKTALLSTEGGRPAAPDSGVPEESLGAQDETRSSAELKKARDTVLMSLPRVTFRRVEYDIKAAQTRFRAVPQLPPSNAARLAKGL